MKDPMSDEQRDQKEDTADKSTDGEAANKPNPFKRLTTDGWDIPDLLPNTDDATNDEPRPEVAALSFDSTETTPQAEDAPDSDDEAEPPVEVSLDEPLAHDSDESAGEAAEDSNEPLDEADQTIAEAVSNPQDEATESAEQASQADAPSTEPADDLGSSHRWFIGAALATALVLVLFISFSGSWQPYYCSTTYGPFVEILEEQPTELPRWMPSEDCRGLKECINGFCRSPEVWNRTSMVGRWRAIILGLDPN